MTPTNHSGRGSPFTGKMVPALKRSLSVSIGVGPARASSKDASVFPGLMRAISGSSSPSCLPDRRSPLTVTCLRRASSRDNIQRGSPLLVSCLRRASLGENDTLQGFKPAKVQRTRSRPPALLIPSSPEQQNEQETPEELQSSPKSSPKPAQTLKIARIRPRPSALTIPSSQGGALGEALGQDSPKAAPSCRRPSALLVPSDAIASPVQRRGASAHRIRPGLTLGSEQFAKNWSGLQQEGISHVLNCARGDNFFEQDGIVYMKLGLTETYQDLEAMQQTLMRSVQFIHDAVQDDQQVLVHCRQGKNRSCAVVVAYLMWSEKKTADEVFEEVRSIREEADPSLAYWMELKTWEQTCLGQLSAQP